MHHLYLCSTVATGHTGGLDIRTLDPALHHFCEQEIVPNTNKTYQSVLCRFAQFCSMYSILTPFPESESLLCYFATHLACQQLSLQTVKVYMATIRYMQITMGLLEPQEYSSMPRLHLGIQRAHASKQATKIRLPITPVQTSQLGRISGRENQCLIHTACIREARKVQAFEL